MMTKKHFKAIASILLGNRFRMPEHVYKTMVVEFIVMCKKENPNLSADTFYEACGIDKDRTFGTLSIKSGVDNTK